MKINPLTPSEEALMHILWKLERAYLKDIMTHYHEPKPHQNTVSTFLKILVEKEFLSTQKEGRIFKYQVTVPFEEYRNFLLKNFISEYYNDSAAQMLRNLMEEGYLETADLDNFSENRTVGNPIERAQKENPISDFIDEITSDKKAKKKGKKKKKKNK